MNWYNWIVRWKKTLEAVEKIGGEDCSLVISPPAAEDEVAYVEKKLGIGLPESFRQVILEFSSGVDFGWDLGESVKLPLELEGIFSGECTWNLKDIVEIESEKKDWVEECFPNPDDEYDRVWHNKLAFMTVQNGDKIAFDMENHTEHTPVVYLSHDGGEGHGKLLGRDFVDFMDRWTLIGCPGMEDWQMMPFIDDKSGIMPYSENAMKWKKIMGLDF